MTDMTGTILVVDDDPFTAELTGMIIEMAGFETVIAEGGLDALEKMDLNPEILAVVSDMNMPFMDGVQLFDELRQQGFMHPFLLITGEDAAPLRVAHPAIDAIMTKDEQLQDNLPGVLASIIAGQ
jgi:CheY-like chemotaxis protein